MLKLSNFQDESKITEEEVLQAVDKETLIRAIKTSKHFKFLPFKNEVIKKIHSMSDEQVQQFIKEAYPQARSEKGLEE